MEQTLLPNSLKKLVLVITGKEPSEDLIAELEEVIEGNGLDDAAKVPAWLPAIFSALAERRTIPASKQTPAETEGASFYNFFDELSHIIPMNWVEFGEYFLMQFASIGLEAKVSLEDTSYEVRAISKTN